MDEHNQGFFLIIRTNFSIFRKGLGITTRPLLPADCPPDTSPDIRIHPKITVPISHQN